MRKKVNYLSNKEIIPEIMEYKRTGIASERYGLMVLTIAKRLSSKPNFAGYTWKDDMVNHAVITCLKYSKNFDAEKYNNPFAYLTTICYNAFQAYLNTQKKHRRIKDECYNKMDMLKNEPYASIDYEELKKWDEISCSKKNIHQIIHNPHQNFKIYEYFNWYDYKNKIKLFEEKHPNIDIVYIGIYGENRSKINAAKKNLEIVKKFNPNLNQKKVILYRIFN